MGQHDLLIKVFNKGTLIPICHQWYPSDVVKHIQHSRSYPSTSCYKHCASMYEPTRKEPWNVMLIARFARVTL